MDIDALKHLWFTFDGRATRSDYWIRTFLPALGLYIVAGILDSILGMGIFMYVAMLAVLVPSIAVAIKRFHDRDMSGWFVLLGLIPFVGGLILLVMVGFLPGTDGDNQYGPNPLPGAGSADAG